MNRFSFNKLFIIVQLASFGCTAQIIEDFQYEYYPVSIQSNQEYYSATAGASPFKYHDSTAIGLHRVNFSWEWAPQKSDNGRCRATNFVLYHKTRINLPELTGSASEQQARQFYYYAELIKQHEMEHYYIAKSYAQVFEQKIRYELGGYSDCDRVEKEIERIFRDVMLEHARQQNAFDERDYKISKIKEVENLLRQYH